MRSSPPSRSACLFQNFTRQASTTSGLKLQIHLPPSSGFPENHYLCRQKECFEELFPSPLLQSRPVPAAHSPNLDSRSKSQRNFRSAPNLPTFRDEPHNSIAAFFLSQTHFWNNARQNNNPLSLHCIKIRSPLHKM